MSLLTLLPINNNKAAPFLISTNTGRINDNVTRPFMTIIDFYTTKTLSYPHEVDNTMLFPLLILLLFMFFVGVIGIPFTQERKDLDILSKWLNSSINLLHKNVFNSVDWYEFVTNATFAVNIAFVGIFIAFLLYKPIYSSFKNLNLINSLKIKVPTKLLFLGEKIINIIYNWSYNRGYIDSFYKASLTASIRGLAEFTQFFIEK